MIDAQLNPRDLMKEVNDTANNLYMPEGNYSTTNTNDEKYEDFSFLDETDYVVYRNPDCPPDDPYACNQTTYGGTNWQYLKKKLFI
jgi:hypothetical protein